MRPSTVAAAAVTRCSWRASSRRSTTSLASFHLGIPPRVPDLEKRRGANLLGEAISRLVPRVTSSERHIDLPPEPLLCPLRGLVDLVAIRSADDEHVDFIWKRPSFSVVPRCPRSVDHQPFNPVDGGELFGDHQRWSEGHQHQLRERTYIRIGLVGRQQLRSADGVDPNHLDLLQSPYFRGDRLIRMSSSFRELVDGP